MTLNDIFQSTESNPMPLVIFFIAIPLLTALFAWVGSGEANKSPWKYIYSLLIYLAAVPGIAAVTLSVYTFLFENKSFLDVNILFYFLPVISMVATIMILKRVVTLEEIPGIGRLSGLVMSIFVIITFMYFLDKTQIHIFAFVRLPVQYLILIFVALLLLLRFGLRRLMKS